MDLNLDNNRLNKIQNNENFKNFMSELEKFLGDNKSKFRDNESQKENISLINDFYNDKKISVKFRDKMLIERANILNNYAQKTLQKGEMYYIYSKNSKVLNEYNLCICKKGRSHTIINETKNNLPKNIEIGSVLRKVNGKYIIDKEATLEISNEIKEMREKILNEQTEFLKSKRLNGHIYEISEINKNSIWLFDVTVNSNEGIEEIDISNELLNNSKQGDMLIYQNGEYRKIN